MKKNYCLLLMLVITFAFTGCDASYSVSGLDNFSSQTCSMGLNDGLLPEDEQFLSEYPYETGTYRYWTDGNYSVAKTFVLLQYSEAIYPQAKAACEEQYSFLETQYHYEDFAFSNPNILFGPPEYDYSGAQMLGCDDDSCTLVFIGFFGYEIDESDVFSQSEFEEFFIKEFSSWVPM